MTVSDIDTMTIFKLFILRSDDDTSFQTRRFRTGKSVLLVVVVDATRFLTRVIIRTTAAADAFGTQNTSV